MMQLKLALFLALGLFTASNAFAGTQASPGYGVSASKKWNLFVDGNSYPRANVDIGWKVFESSGSSSAVLVTDEIGRSSGPASCGVLHQICLNGGSVSVFDSTTASPSPAFVQGRSAKNLIPPLYYVQGNTNNGTGVSCFPISIDAQFHNGLVVMNSSDTTTTNVYWRPCLPDRN